METASQQTEDVLYNEEPRSLCETLKSYICGLIVAIVFVGIALVFAIIYRGYGVNNRIPTKVQEAPNILVRQHSWNFTSANLSSVNKYPFIGSLLAKKPTILLCTAVILTSKYLLTGANCFTTDFHNLYIRVGSNLWDSYGKTYRVKNFIINPEFNGKTMENNIALIHVENDITMGKIIKPVKVTAKLNISNGVGLVLGWNFWGTPERERGHLLQQEVVIWNYTRCANYLNDQYSIQCICASLHNTQYDLHISGPLIIEDELVGYWSWGLSSAKVPSVFTNVYYFKQWFNTIIY